MHQQKQLLKIALICLLGFMMAKCQKEDLNSDNGTELKASSVTSSVTSGYLQDLIGTIEQMLNDGILDKGNANALIVKINNAIKSVDKGNITASDGQLNAFINETEEFIDTGIIPVTEGQELINSAENAIMLADGFFMDTRDGYEYPVVLIGEQFWMAENLKTTMYQNGDLIGTTTPATLDLSGEDTPKYQWAYNGDEDNAVTMGRLYTYYAITDSRGVCPVGWHVPSDGEWTTLTNYLGVNAGSKLKETGTAHWPSPNAGATNETGFTAIPGGLRTFDGFFVNYPYYARYWSTTEVWSGVARGRSITSYSNGVQANMLEEKDGNSVRCIKD